MFIRILRETAAGDGTGGGGAAATATQGASGTAPIFTQGDPASQAAAAAAQKANEDFVKSIPETYREKPYLKGVDSPDKLFKLLDGSQELIGKRPAGVPAADAPKEQWDAFYKTLGRPDEPSGYQFEGADKSDPKFVAKLQEVFHKRGLSAEQAKGIYADVNVALQEMAKEKGLADQQANVDFDKLADTTFGPEREAKLARAKAIMTEHAPQELLKHLGSLSNENLVIMAGVIDSIATKFIAPDKLPGSGQGGTTPGAQTMEQRRAEARQLMLSKEFNDPFHPDHEKTRAKVTELYSPLRTAAK